MKTKTALSAILLTAALLFTSCEKNEKTQTEIPTAENTFEFTIMKAGQADAIIMQTANHSIILDCGEKDDGDEVVEFLQERGISSVDYIFITHFDKDHVGGFPEIMENVTASNIIVPNYTGNNDEYEAYLETVAAQNLGITVLSEDTHIVIDDVLFQISVPKKKAYAEGDNDFSLVMSVTHGENTFLFAGDAEKERLAEVLSEFGTQHDFLKVPHHGKHNSNTKRFINTVKPKYAVITDSDKNPASTKTASYLASLKTEVYSTKDGDVKVTSDGKEIKITQ